MNKYTTTKRSNQPIAVLDNEGNVSEEKVLKQLEQMHEQLLLLPWKSHRVQEGNNQSYTLELFEKDNQSGHLVYRVEVKQQTNDAEVSITGGRGVDVFRQWPAKFR
ncbi:hypothetical protein [Geomicrobium sp. JCM 19039]|uniref:hypothetical protein n=1 Tax=Geomicrobium sp. JCM 19039 TaxID=1460636 RepID=UPI00045F47F1|nr:hypothetical protein [Geomicrobium sp. JCM 19039]GAK11083.1 hypothetical protein JCM19039_756 [Geomicrobium sp. JCM 19039]